MSKAGVHHAVDPTKAGVQHAVDPTKGAHNEPSLLKKMLTLEEESGGKTERATGSEPN